MKKWIALALAALLVLSLAGCGQPAKTLDLDKAVESIEALELFPNPYEPDDDTLKAAFGLDPALLTQRYIVLPLMNVHASELWVLLPAEGKAEEVKAAMDSYLADYQELWDNYLPDQAELVRGRAVTELETKEGVWLIYCISQDNDRVLEALNGALV